MKLDPAELQPCLSLACKFQTVFWCFLHLKDSYKTRRFNRSKTVVKGQISYAPSQSALQISVNGLNQISVTSLATWLCLSTICGHFRLQTWEVNGSRCQSSLRILQLNVPGFSTNVMKQNNETRAPHPLQPWQQIVGVVHPQRTTTAAEQQLQHVPNVQTIYY